MKTSNRSKAVCFVYSNLGLGGMPTRIVGIVNAMEKSHPDSPIYILLKKKHQFDQRSKIINPKTVIYDFPKTLFGNNTLIFIFWLWYFLLTHNIGTIFTFISPYALPVLVAKRLFFWKKYFVVVNEGHYTSTIVETMLLPWIQKMGIRSLYPYADKIIVPTQYIKDDLHIIFSVPTNIITIVPNWSEYAHLPLAKSSRPIDIIITGRLEETKHPLQILSIIRDLIIANHASLQCLFLGEGSLEKTCRAYIHDNHLSKFVTIRPPTLTSIRYVSKAKIFLFYPDDKAEGFPVALLDAMACGAIIVTKSFQGISDVLTNKNAYILNTDQKIVKKIIYIIHHFSQQRKIALVAKDSVNNNNSKTNIFLYTKYVT